MPSKLWLDILALDCCLILNFFAYISKKQNFRLDITSMFILQRVEWNCLNKYYNNTVDTTAISYIHMITMYGEIVAALYHSTHTRIHVTWSIIQTSKGIYIKPNRATKLHPYNYIHTNRATKTNTTKNRFLRIRLKRSK